MRRGGISFDAIDWDDAIDSALDRLRRQCKTTEDQEELRLLRSRARDLFLDDRNSRFRENQIRIRRIMNRMDNAVAQMEDDIHNSQAFGESVVAIRGALDTIADIIMAGAAIA